MSQLSAAFHRLPLAHRALHDVHAGRPENSRAAIEAAIAAGYGIEIDLQLSRDGHAMVFHDYDLGRLTDQKGPIQQRSAEDLMQIDLRGGQEGIPTFAEVLRIVAGRTPVLVELKDQHGQMGQADGRLERAVAQDVQGYGGPLALMSFNPYSVAALRDLVPMIPRGLTTCAFSEKDWPLLKADRREALRDIPDYNSTGASFISHAFKDLSADRVAALRGSGASVLCWTIRSRQAERDARQFADNITFEGYLPDIPS
ncbi:MAG: glycerophosphodiester phosphodiesterase family protein [Roseovarius gahaiensis]